MSAPESGAASLRQELSAIKSADTLDACGLSCGRLEPLIGKRLRALSPGQVLEILSDQPEAGDGIAAWVWLTGHALVAVTEAPPHTRYYVRKEERRA